MRSGFRKSSRCDPCCDKCVEVDTSAMGSSGERMVAVRDTKNLKHLPMHFTVDEWKAFIAGVKNGEFDLS